MLVDAHVYPSVATRTCMNEICMRTLGARRCVFRSEQDEEQVDDDTITKAFKVQQINIPAQTHTQTQAHKGRRYYHTKAFEVQQTDLHVHTTTQRTYHKALCKYVLDAPLGHQLTVAEASKVRQIRMCVHACTHAHTHQMRRPGMKLSLKSAWRDMTGYAWGRRRSRQTEKERVLSRASNEHITVFFRVYYF